MMINNQFDPAYNYNNTEQSQYYLQYNLKNQFPNNNQLHPNQQINLQNLLNNKQPMIFKDKNVSNSINSIYNSSSGLINHNINPQFDMINTNPNNKILKSSQSVAQYSNQIPQPSQFYQQNMALLPGHQQQPQQIATSNMIATPNFNSTVYNNNNNNPSQQTSNSLYQNNNTTGNVNSQYNEAKKQELIDKIKSLEQELTLRKSSKLEQLDHQQNFYKKSNKELLEVITLLLNKQNNSPPNQIQAPPMIPVLNLQPRILAPHVLQPNETVRQNY